MSARFGPRFQLLPLSPPLAAHEEPLPETERFDAHDEATGQLAEVLTSLRSRRADMLKEKRAGSLRPSASLVKGDGQPSNVYMRDQGVFTLCIPLHGPLLFV
jgi:hypothetical protein